MRPIFKFSLDMNPINRRDLERVLPRLQLSRVTPFPAQQQQQDRQQLTIVQPNPLVAVRLHTFTNRELHEATNGFTNKLGKGRWGGLYQGMLAGGTTVAVKRLELDEFAADGLSRVCSLCIFLHPYLIPLLGFSCSEGQPPCLVYPLMVGGSLADRIRQQPPPLTFSDRVELAMQVAEALAYLHDSAKQVLLKLSYPVYSFVAAISYLVFVLIFG